MLLTCVVLLVAASGWSTCAVVEAPVPARECQVWAKTESGPVCGRLRGAGPVYASFRGVPYAKQPLGELRFKELQPAEPWDLFDATEEGPICPQTDIFYGRIMRPSGMSEACIHANIHVPVYALPEYNMGRSAREIQSPYVTGYEQQTSKPERQGLPILVFIHGGSFAFGSGDADLHGPEDLVSEGIIVITFNYRLNVFGFLSLNTTSVPGNNGLRDMITLLKWVQRNARSFGGDPTRVTIAGQSAGAAAAHILTLTEHAKGLFQRAIIMSGSAIPSFYTTLPIYAQTMARVLTQALGINSTEPEVIHQELIAMPLEKIIAANSLIQDQQGIVSFFPVVESPLPGVTRILDQETEKSVQEGRGKDIPLIVGYTDVECETFRPRFEKIKILNRVNDNPLILLPASVIFTSPPAQASESAKRIEERYFEGNQTMEGYIKACTDTHMKYPQLKLAQYRQAVGGAPMYLYRFSYNGNHSVMKEAMGLNYTGAGHVEDLTYVFKVNSVPVRSSWSDTYMRWLMTSYVTNFMRTGDPTQDSSWGPVDSNSVKFLNIESPVIHNTEELTPQQKEIIYFFDSIRGSS